MIRRIKNLLKNVVPKSLQEKRIARSYNKYQLISYSQEGEDLILNRIFGNKPNGFYVDVGAHHPVRFSNTYFFYKKGWRGINLDAMPGSMKAFKSLRPLDINLEIPVSSSPNEMEYYIFNEPALNGFSKEISLERDQANTKYKIEKIVKLKSETLESILNKHLPKNQKIDYFTVDVEGLDLDVLKSNNWTKYRPDYVLVEILTNDLPNIAKNNVYHFLTEIGYAFHAKSINTCFFRRKDI